GCRDDDRQHLLLGEDVLRDHAVHAFADVDDLRHAAVADHRCQRVGLVTAHRHDLLAGEEIHRLTRRDLHRLVQILVEAGDDPVRGRLDTGPLELHILADDRLDHDLAPGALERGEVDLPIALAAVRVARPDESALEKDRQVQNRAFLQLVDVHVRAVLPRSQRARTSFRVLDRRSRLLFRLVRIGSHADDAWERLEVDEDAGLELRLLFLPVEVVVADEALGKLWRELTDGGELRAGQMEVRAERLRHDLFDADLEHVAGLRAGHVDGAGHGMRAAAGIGEAQLDELLYPPA